MAYGSHLSRQRTVAHTQAQHTDACPSAEPLLPGVPLATAPCSCLASATTQKMKELESSQLFNPQLNLVSPSLPQFWKHDRENAAFYSTYGVREAAKSPKKLLPSDYDWLGAPPGLDPVASVRDSAQTGPAALQNTRYAVPMYARLLSAL